MTERPENSRPVDPSPHPNGDPAAPGARRAADPVDEVADGIETGTGSGRHDDTADGPAPARAARSAGPLEDDGDFGEGDITPDPAGPRPSRAAGDEGPAPSADRDAAFRRDGSGGSSGRPSSTPHPTRDSAARTSAGSSAVTRSSVAGASAGAAIPGSDDPNSFAARDQSRPAQPGREASDDRAFSRPNSEADSGRGHSARTAAPGHPGDSDASVSNNADGNNPGGTDTGGGDAATPPRKRRRGLWIGLVALLVVLLVAGALGLRSRLNPAPPPKQPADVAIAWFNALAAGDVTGANALVQEKPRGPLTTPESWKQYLADHPISDVKVTGSEPGKVTLGYRSGEAPASVEVPMVGEGVNLKVRSATTTFVVTPQPELLPMTVDGQKVDRSQEGKFTVEVFPGVHQISTGSRWLQYNQTGLDASSLGEWRQVAGATSSSADFEGAMRAQIEGRITECMQQKSLAPQASQGGCPWAFASRPGDEPDPASISWRLDGDLRDFVVKPPTENDALVDGSVTIPLSLTAKTRTGASLDQQQTVEATFRADMLSAGPDFIWLN